MKTKTNTKDNITQHFKANLKLYVPLAVVSFYILSLVIPVISSFTRLPIVIIQCGGMPVMASDYAHSYDKPDDKYYGITIFTSQYFCTEAEAQAAGFRHNVLNEPIRPEN